MVSCALASWIPAVTTVSVRAAVVSWNSSSANTNDTVLVPGVSASMATAVPPATESTALPALCATAVLFDPGTAMSTTPSVAMVHWIERPSTSRPCASSTRAVTAR